MVEIEVRGAPGYYACEVGVLEQLDSLLESNRITKVLIIHGKKSWEAVEPYFPDITKAAINFIPYRGECSLSEMERFSALVYDGEYDAVMGIGGGKVLDLAKSVGNQTGRKVILIPTLAATCAAWTPLSVFYNEEGHFTHYTMFPKSTEIVLFEPRVILDSPVSYLTAGIADTLAKWYEADVLIRDMVNPPLVVQIAHQSAKLCQNVLLEHGIKAVNDFESKELSSSLLQALEANIVLGGMVGGFGDQYGRISGAHAVHNGLTKVPDTHHLLHGEKVAYGILVQLVLEENWEEIKSLYAFYKSLRLPTSFEELGLTEKVSEKISKIAEAIVLPTESIHLLKMEITQEKIEEAFYLLEKFILNLN